MWEAVPDTVKERLGEKKHQKNQPWFDEENFMRNENKQGSDGQVIKAK